jgi:inhibitor of cysteine peptidase
MSDIQLDESHNGGTVSAAVGSTVIVRLPENPTTGYRWQIDAAAGLTMLGDDFSPADSSTGAGGVRHWRLLAASIGSFQFTASLRRPWETSVMPQAQFRVSIHAT